jgi:hypothetical protein
MTVLFVFGLPGSEKDRTVTEYVSKYDQANLGNIFHTSISRLLVAHRKNTSILESNIVLGDVDYLWLDSLPNTERLTLTQEVVESSITTIQEHFGNKTLVLITGHLLYPKKNQNHEILLIQDWMRVFDGCIYLEKSVKELHESITSMYVRVREIVTLEEMKQVTTQIKELYTDLQRVSGVNKCFTIETSEKSPHIIDKEFGKIVFGIHSKMIPETIREIHEAYNLEIRKSNTLF